MDKDAGDQRFGDNLFDIHLLFADKVFHDASQYDSHQTEVRKIFHDIPYSSKIDIHMQYRSIYPIVGHQLTS